MDHNEVQLIGVIDPEGKAETFTYTVDAPNNLWIGAICDDGTRMGHAFQAHILNGILDNDQFIEGGVYAIRSGGADGPILLAEVGEVMDGAQLEANLANTSTVRIVRVRVV